MRKLLFCLILLNIFISEDSYATLPPPYDTVDLLPYNPQGWYFGEKTMEWLIKSNNVKVVVEVGSWFGLSTCHIARTIPEGGVVYAVDHWLGSPHEIHNRFVLANLYRQFLSNVIHENLTDKIIPVRMSSEEAAKTLNVKPDLVYIDASHDFNSVCQDLALWYPFVKGHGILCGDDYLFGRTLPVKAAVDLFAQTNNLIVHEDGWFWYLEERK